MTSKPRSSRRAPAPPPPASASGGDGRSRWILGAAAVVIVGAAVLAIVLGGGLSGPGSSPAVPTSPGTAGASAASGAPATSGASTPAPPAASASSGASGAAGDAPVISGSPLPQFPATGDDPAKGLTAPTVQGASFDGTPVAIEPAGRPTAVLFIAHWCPHCQREVPLIQSWISANGMPQGVDFVSVATGIDPAAPNYPPQTWLANEGWTVPVIVDPTNSVARAYGLSAYPFWVFLDSGGKVVLRATGELTIDNITTILATLAAT
jgi:cytochrome c biogenesis protein CcmG/thiol:disulfide interchange protein DsbE